MVCLRQEGVLQEPVFQRLELQLSRPNEGRLHGDYEGCPHSCFSQRLNTCSQHGLAKHTQSKARLHHIFTAVFNKLVNTSTQCRNQTTSHNNLGSQCMNPTTHHYCKTLEPNQKNWAFWTKGEIIYTQVFFINMVYCSSFPQKFTFFFLFLKVLLIQSIF